MTRTRLWWLIPWFVLALGACAYLRTPGLVPPTPTPSPTPTAVPPTPTPTPLPLTTLRVWLPPAFDPGADSPAAHLMQERLRAFAAAEGLALDVRIKDPEGAGGMLPTLADAEVVAPAAVPQVILVSRATLETMALKGLLAPLNGLPNAPLPDEETDFPFAVALGRVQAVPYGVPLAGEALVMYAPPDAFADEGRPATWDDLMAHEGLPWRWAAGDPQARFLLGLYAAAGGPLRTEDGRPTLDAAVLARVLQDLADLRQRGLITPSLLDLSEDDAVWRFYGENANSLLFLRHTYWLSTPTRWQIGPIPAPQGQPWSWADGYAWVVPRQDAQRLALAARLLRHLSDDAFVGAWSEARGLLPPGPTALDAWEEAALAAQLRPLAESARLIPPLDVLTTVGPALHQALEQILTAAATPSEAAQQAAQALTP